MSIKSDSWIRRMALEHAMIEPFEATQVRERAGQKVISYGLSSYGYDIRCADEFKIFTNVNSVVVDPKAFDKQSLVDFKGEVCIIPPNSFALARTVEHFRIPRNVLAVCVGKSTYARCAIVVNVTPLEPCLSDDSEILTNVGWKHIADVAIGDYVLTRREDGVAEYQPIERKQERLYCGEMLHFSGKSVDQLVTPEHKLFVWRRNSQLNTYTNMTLEAREIFGKHNYSFDRLVEWNSIEEPPTQVDIGGRLFPLDPFLKFLGCWLGDGSAFKSSDGGYVIKLAAVTKQRKFDYYEQVLQELGINNARRQERGWIFYNKSLAKYLMQFGHAKEKFIDRQWMNLPPDKLAILIEGMIESDGNRETMTYTTASKQLADDFQEIVFKSGAEAIVRIVEGEIEDRHYTVYKVRICSNCMQPKMSPMNHKKIQYEGMVYDVTVPNHVFFCRRNGKASWTGNCWEGHLTIEISNTSPLPAKIYANEGIAQLLFFESDEICEVSYQDRGGKYQGQQGVTLART